MLRPARVPSGTAGRGPEAEGLLYAPEAYDATIIIALAAQAAGNDSGRAIGDTLKQVTADGEKCTYADCLALLNDGKDIDYDGQSGPIDLNDVGDPSKAIMGIYTYGPDNTYANVLVRRRVTCRSPSRAEALRSTLEVPALIRRGRAPRCYV